MTHTATANSVITEENEVTVTAAFYLGVALIVTTCISTMFLPHAGMLPTLFLISLFQIICIMMPDHLATYSGRRALVIAGSITSLSCHLALTWLLQIVG